MLVRAELLSLAILSIAAPANAQVSRVITQTIATADSALNAGDLDRADSLYYVAVRAFPRDPIAREALGRYLAMRGATRVAVVLLEEARMFGGDPTAIGAQLAPLYQTLGDWRAVLTMPASPLNATERRRAAWLADHAPGSRTDTSSVLLAGPPKGDTLGRVAVRIGTRTAMAVVLATDVGVTIGQRFAGDAVHAFGGNDSASVVLDSMSIGSMKLTNLTATIGGAVGAVTLGIASLNRLTPTIDYGRNRFSAGRPATGGAATRLPLLRVGGQLRVLLNQHWVSLSELATSVARVKQTMTIDLRTGEVRVTK